MLSSDPLTPQARSRSDSVADTPNNRKQQLNSSVPSLHGRVIGKRPVESAKEDIDHHTRGERYNINLLALRTTKGLKHETQVEKYVVYIHGIKYLVKIFVNI